MEIRNELPVGAYNLQKVKDSSEYIELLSNLKTSPTVINDATSYESVKDVLRRISAAMAVISERRMEVTRPLDKLKADIMDVEKELVSGFKSFVDSRKAMMVAYSNELERKQREANEKIRKEAELALKNSNAENIAEVMGHFTDELVSISIEQPSGIRKTIKAQVSKIQAVDWSSVINTLDSAGMFDPEVLLKNLPKAMKDCGVIRIKGIELVEVKTQTIR